ncbi:MAG: hypothetical protein HON98_00245 [Chloroflexi bacterium]|jgi:hypothetical protein|nr:hypothetical protein [Chloroflexota bacterium]MBT4003940.1 hypothetical protein [Chloroflexota bacterium]MBT4305754.1 hypothetical protein [Chloroflexota bacterium]MBT4533578.1 hypothetical protein [Chloroflexota bacterium]MBT4681779.1 hypothetical protein [Chloroflexota bacterium]
MKRIIPFIILLALLIPVGVLAAPDQAPDIEVTVPGGPTFWVHDVQRNDSITLSVENFPAGKTYQVILSYIGGHFAQGMVVGGLDDNLGSKFTKTFTIPYRLYEERLLGVMVRDSKNEQNYAYNVFANLDDWNSLKPYSLYPVAHSSAQSNGTSVDIWTGPDVWVQHVSPNKTFTISMKYLEGDTQPTSSMLPLRQKLTAAKPHLHLSSMWCKIRKSRYRLSISLPTQTFT